LAFIETAAPACGAATRFTSGAPAKERAAEVSDSMVDRPNSEEIRWRSRN